MLLSALLLAAGTGALALPDAPQVVMSVPQPDRMEEGAGGVLRRYSVPAGQAEGVLAYAQENEWDVWHATPSFVDVHFPAPAPPSARSHPYAPLLANYTDTPLPAPSHALHAQLRAEPWDLPSLANATFHAAYRPLADIERFMRDLARAHPDRVRVAPIGHSGEGREMYALEIAAPANASRTEPKIGFALTGAQHAREWVATATAVYLAHALVADRNEPYSLASLLDDFDFYIVPVPNPDGYVYTWDTDRFWYKNRQALAAGARCTGVDMNRNWGYKWKANPKFFGPESSPAAAQKKKGGKKKKRPAPPADPCSHWYPGTRPFQAAEVSALARYLEPLPALRAFLDLRAYGQILSAPYSYSCAATPKDAEDLLEATHGAAFAARRAHGAGFTTGSLCATLYRAPGNAVDYMYKKVGVKWSFAAHLRDTGTYGFMLPPEWIRVVGEETSGMVGYLARFIAGKEV